MTRSSAAGTGVGDGVTDAAGEGGGVTWAAGLPQAIETKATVMPTVTRATYHQRSARVLGYCLKVRSRGGGPESLQPVKKLSTSATAATTTPA